MNIFRHILSGAVKYSLYPFVVFSIVVSIVSGFADVVNYSRSSAAQREWKLDARAEGEYFVEENYVPVLITGFAAFAMFAAAVVLAVRFFLGKFDTGTHILIVAVTALTALIFFLPRPPIGTGTEGMREVFSYLMLLGIIETLLYRTFVLDDGSAGSS